MLSDNAEASVATNNHPRLNRMLRVEWLGQTIASVCWIGSVLAYGISSFGDWLQLAAASAWLMANIAVVLTTNDD